MPSVYWLYPWWTRNHRNGLKISTNVKYKLVSVICFPLTCFSLVSCRSFSYQPTWPNPIEFRFILLLLTYQSMTWTDYLSDKKKKVFNVFWEKMAGKYLQFALWCGAFAVVLQPPSWRLLRCYLSVQCIYNRPRVIFVALWPLRVILAYWTNE